MPVYADRHHISISIMASFVAVCSLCGVWRRVVAVTPAYGRGLLFGGEGVRVLEAMRALEGIKPLKQLVRTVHHFSSCISLSLVCILARDSLPWRQT